MNIAVRLAVGAVGNVERFYCFCLTGTLLHLANAGRENEQTLLAGEEELTIGVVDGGYAQDGGEIDIFWGEDHRVF
jgi:hypothetical protein